MPSINFIQNKLLYLLLCPKRGMIGGVILLADRCHSLRDVEGAAGQGASLTSASGPPLHLVQLAAAATLTEALATKLQNKRGLGVGTQMLWIKT